MDSRLEKQRRLHFDLINVGLRAQATAAGLVRLCIELRDADILTEEALLPKIVKLEHAWRRLDGRNDDGFQVAPFPG